MSASGRRTEPPPELTRSGIGAVVRQLRRGRQQLRELGTEGRLAALAGVHSELAADRNGALSVLAGTLAARTGYPAPLIREHLGRLCRQMDAPALERWLEHLAQAAPGARPVPPSRVLVVGSGNLPAVALPTVVQALLLGSPVLVKPAAAEPDFFPAYAALLDENCPALAGSLVVACWSGGDREVEDALLEQVGAVAAYGSDTALRDLRARCRPGIPFLAYGTRLSFAAVSREALRPEWLPRVAARAARDIAEFDQQGCLSPQLLFVEEGGPAAPGQFCEALAAALAAYRRRLPPRALEPAAAAAIHQFRAGVEMAALSGDGTRLWTGGHAASWSVALIPTPALEPCPLNRTAVVHPVANLESLPELLPTSSLLLSAALAVPPERRPAVEEALAELGVNRFCLLGHSQRPAHLLLHDGLHALCALARFQTRDYAAASGR